MSHKTNGVHIYKPAGSHGAPDENRLPSELVVHRDEGMVGREGTSGAFSMYQQVSLLTIQHVRHRESSQININFVGQFTNQQNS